MENNKVLVNIYGKEYTVAGDRPAEQIMRIASHVDLRMQQIADANFNGALSELAVLAAMNIAEECFDLTTKVMELKEHEAKMEQDGKRYEQLWDESKKNLSSYKEESQSEINVLKEKQEELRTRLFEKDKELDELRAMSDKRQSEVRAASEGALNEAEHKYKDMENNYFDLQMENIQLKSEIEKLKNSRG